MQFKLLGIQGATSIEVVTAATAKLSGAELVAAIASANLTKEEQKSILMKHGLSGAELEAAMQTLAHSAANTTATVSTGALTTATGGLSAAFRGLTVAMASNPIGAIAVAIATVIGLVSTAITVFSNWSNSIEDVKDKANELKNDFDSRSNVISENTEKLKSLKSEFEKLSKGVSEYGENISLTGDEYERYKEIVQTILGISPSLTEGYNKEGTALANKNGLLEKSIALMEEEQRLEKEKLTRTDNLVTFLNAGKEDINTARDNVNNINKPNDISFGSTIKNGKSDGLGDILFNGGKFSGERNGFRSPIEKYIEHIIGIEKETWESESDYILRNYNEIYKHMDAIISDSQKNFTDDNGEYIGFTDSQAESFRNYLLQFKDYIDEQEQVNSEFNDYLQLIPESMREYSGLNDSSKSFLSEWIKKNFTIDENTTEQDIKDFSSKIRKFTKQIADDKDLQSLFDFGTELTTDTDNKSLSVEAYQNKVKEFIDKVNNLNDEDTKLYIKTVFGFENSDDDLAKDISDKIKRVKNILVDSDDGKVSGLSMQELNIAYNISAEEGSLTFDELQDKIKETAQKSKESVFELSEAQTKQIKQINSDYDKLNKVYNDLFSKKEHSEIESDVWELVSSFPELYQYIDWTDEKFGNLAEGIDKVISGLSTDLVTELEAIDPSKLSDDGKKALQSIISVMKMMHPTLKTTVNLIEDIQKAIKGVSSSISTLIGFTKEISSDGALSLSSIDTIMTDDTYKSLRPYINDMESMQTAITELTNKQKDAYEDLYNAEMYENDYEAYRAELDKKYSKGESYIEDSIKEIQKEIKDIENQYDVDLTNWDNLSETKKTILQNTNAELLLKQASLINTFKSYYDTDLTNYKNTTAAKAAILDNFRKSEAFAQASKIAIDNNALGNDRGNIYLADEEGSIKKKINSVLSASGLTWQDYIQYLNNGTFTSKGNEALQKTLDEIVKAYTITPPDWDKMTANIRSTGGSSSSSSSSSKNYIDWIERRLKKFAQNTKEVFARVADYISFNNQNSQLRKAINAIRDEIAFNKRAYNYYMEAANQVGLDPYWIDAVVNGARNISDIQNEELREKINRYKELYDQAIDCKNAVEDLKKTEKEYATQMLSNVEKYYSNRITYANSDAEYYNSLDTDNLFMSKNFDAIRKSYNEQISYTQKEHDDLLSTLNSLVSNGSIKYQSDEWYEWWDKIQKCNVEIRNLKKNVHDLANEELQNIQGYWDNRIGTYDNTISYINTVGGDTTRNGSKDYKGLSSAYNTQIGYVNKQVSELQTRLEEAVKAGDIEKYSDKWYEWTGIIEQGKEKVTELQANIHKLAVEQFEKIQKNYDNQLNLFEHTAKEYENKNKEIETRGLLANSKYYSKLQENEKNNILILKNQAKDLEDSLNQAVKSGNIEVGSEEWYKMRDAILSVNEQIDESNIKLLEYAKTIREIGWEAFSFLQDRISQLTTESDFLIDLMSNAKLFDDSGNITAKGRATMGLHTQNYNVYMAQAEQYAAEIRKVNAQLAKDPHNTDIIKHREELLGLQQKSILAAEKEKKAIVDLTKQGFDEQLKSLKKLIETYTKSLDAAKSLYDYQKNINEKTSNISKLQKQLNAYQGDNSEETQAKIQQLQTELKEAQEDLQQTEYEKLISDTKSLLDDLYDDYEETLNNRLDNVDALVGDMIGVVNNNSSDISTTIKSSAAEVGAILSKEITDIWTGKGAVNGNIVSNYYNGFDTKLTSVQTTLNNISSYVSILAKAGENDVKTTTSNTTKKATTTTTKKSSTPQGTINQSNTNNNANSSNSNKGNTNGIINKLGKSGTNGTTSSLNKGNTKNNSTNTQNKSSRSDKENYGVALAIINGNYGWGAGEVRKKNLTAKGFNYNTVQGIVNKLWKEGYVHTGAWKGKYYGVSDLSPYAYKKFKSGGLVDYTGIAQVDGTPMKPESFLNADDTQNIADLRDTLRELAARPITMANGMGALGMFGGTVTPNILDMSQKLQALSGSDMVQNLNVHNENHIEIDIDKVEDYNDFIAKMQKDRKFENIIQDMTFGRMTGGSSLAKYRH